MKGFEFGSSDKRKSVKHYKKANTGTQHSRAELYTPNHIVTYTALYHNYCT